MKWTREKPGCYVSGTWKITGEATAWQLWKGESLAFNGNSKKACQQRAEENELITPTSTAVDLDPDPEYTPTRPAKVHSGSANPAKYPLDSVLVSLGYQMENLNSRMAQLTDSNNKLAEAILLLAKHTAKLSK